MATLELCWRSAASSAVPPLGVIEHLDVVEDVGPGRVTGRVDLPTNAFALEQLEEALRHGVVVAVPTTTHAGDEVVLAQEVLPLVARELAALVRVQHDWGLGSSSPQRHQQRVEDQDRVDAAAHGPSDDLTREQVHDHRQVQPAFVCADVRDVGDPRLVWLVDAELPLQVIGRDYRGLAASNAGSTAIPRLRAQAFALDQ